MNQEKIISSKHERKLIDRDFNHDDVQLGMKIGVILNNEGLKRVIQYFLNLNNKPSYHNEIFRTVRGSKTTVSNALQVLSQDLQILDSSYVQIPRDKPTPRMISVLMFWIKDEYLEILQHYI